MANTTPYWDKRSTFFQDFFNSAHSYDEYLNTGEENHRKRWGKMEESIHLSEAQVSTVGKFQRKMNILAMSGIWCGDCARQGPMLRAIEKASSVITLRFIDNKANPELQNELRIIGAEKVPVVVSLSEDFLEIGRFGDRHLSVYKRKAEKELGAACDPGILPPNEEELTTELDEWVEYFLRQQLILRLSPMLRQRYDD